MQGPSVKYRNDVLKRMCSARISVKQGCVRQYNESTRLAPRHFDTWKNDRSIYNQKIIDEV